MHWEETLDILVWNVCIWFYMIVYVVGIELKIYVVRTKKYAIITLTE